MTSIAAATHNDIPACIGCARCCHLLVELEPGVDDVPESMVATYSGTRFMDQQSNGACVALDPATLACTIYDRRPTVCRTFERGGGLCRSILIGAQSLRDHVAASGSP